MKEKNRNWKASSNDIQTISTIASQNLRAASYQPACRQPANDYFSTNTVLQLDDAARSTFTKHQISRPASLYLLMSLPFLSKMRFVSSDAWTRWFLKASCCSILAPSISISRSPSACSPVTEIYGGIGSVGVDGRVPLPIGADLGMRFWSRGSHCSSGFHTSPATTL